MAVAVSARVSRGLIAQYLVKIGGPQARATKTGSPAGPLAAPRRFGDDSSMAKPRKILFVCMGNCVRSQMAEALARHHFPDDICAESAGIHPLGFIDPTARAVVEE